MRHSGSPGLALVVVSLVTALGALSATADGVFASTSTDAEKKDEAKRAPAGPAGERPRDATPDRRASSIVQAARPGAGESSEPVKVYTNDDLDRVWAGSVEARVERRSAGEPTESGRRRSGDAATGAAELRRPAARGSAPRPGASEPDAAPDPLAALQRARALEAERDERIAVAEADAARAASRVQAIEKRLRLLRNPLLGAPAPPQTEDAEADAEWSKLDGAERVRRSERELLEARDELTRAEEALERSRREP